MRDQDFEPLDPRAGGGRGARAWATALALLGMLAGAPAQAAEDAEKLAERAKAVFGTLPEVVESEDNPVTPEKVALGRKLYFEDRISISGTISCNSCHMLDSFGVDNEPTSPGHEGKRGERNSPTVYNAALHIDQFWDGRADDVEEQAKGPVLNPVEMGMPSEGFVNRMLKAIPGYRPLFEKAFPDDEDPVDFDNFALAVGAFERKLTTPGPFDAFMQGDLDALSEQEQRGLATFMGVGCITCHQGPALGGTMYRKVGLVYPYETEDLGRYKVTGEESDEHVFKVPGLRNVARTAPYFHDGSVATLPEAVELMAHHQLGQELSDEQVADIVVFLTALTGEPPAIASRPELPPDPDQLPTPEG